MHIRARISTHIIATLVAGGLLAAGPALAGIKGSKHDLGTGGAAQATTAQTTEVCVFCHTPHGSNTGASAPLWNKTLPTTTYTRYSSLGTATLDGSEVPVGSVSLACLSCHDGTQAMDVVLNAPGSGGYTATGAELDALSIGTMTGTPVPTLGSDLRDDHPVSIAYAGGACTGNTTPTCIPANATTGDKDFQTAQYASINGNDQWWVDTTPVGAGGTSGVREKTDMILYTRDFGGVNGPSVECASCHDPHEDVARPVSFLRVANDDSGVCLACHIK